MTLLQLVYEGITSAWWPDCSVKYSCDITICSIHGDPNKKCDTLRICEVQVKCMNTQQRINVCHSHTGSLLFIIYASKSKERAWLVNRYQPLIKHDKNLLCVLQIPIPGWLPIHVSPGKWTNALHILEKWNQMDLQKWSKAALVQFPRKHNITLLFIMSIIRTRGHNKNKFLLDMDVQKYFKRRGTKKRQVALF